MRKNLLVFCCVTLLTALLFGCNGVSAFASDNTANVFPEEIKKEGDFAEKISIKKSVDRKNNKKRVKKSKKNKKKVKKAITIDDYVKNGKFDHNSYGKAIGANTLALDYNLGFQIGEYFVELNTNLQNTEKYYIGIGYLSRDRKKEDFTFFAIFEEGWGRSIEYKNGLTLPYNGLIKLQEVVNYVKKQKKPNPYSAPKLDGYNWNDGNKFDELF